MLDRTVAAMRDLIFNMGFFTYKTTVALLRPSQASPNFFRAFSYNANGVTSLTPFTSALQIALSVRRRPVEGPLFSTR